MSVFLNVVTVNAVKSWKLELRQKSGAENKVQKGIVFKTGLWQILIGKDGWNLNQGPICKR